MTSKKKLDYRGPSDGKRTTHRWGTWRREGHTDTSRRLAYRPTAKRWKLEDLYERVVQEVLSRKEGKHPDFVVSYVLVRVEELADQFRAKTHLVHQCLHRMIREGYGLRESNGGLHDTRRDGPTIPPDADMSHLPNGWMATHYTLWLK